ncbi:helix-turn-helix domain-containing protein [Pseudoclavibacter sp. CFCC 14310]|uniref:helix-turn-helix domain-containing protein n=1 Tax=Pseudoclavibacter sp. CFCC 14310 TaxID=2615180 RepID=UPI001CE44967|nr:helix-turn-helix transcriptional regulator [Pseudoclavibacter sp. CFCC 14310]
MNLAIWRRQRGLTQEDLAASLGFSAKYLSSVERGKRNLSLASVERLASDIGVDPLELLRRP